MNLNKNQNILISFFTTLIVSFFAELYVLAVETSLNITNFSQQFSFKHFIFFAVISFIIFRILYDSDLRNKFFDFIYKNRYYLSFVVIAVCVVFQIHGSSINELNLFNVNHNPLFGISRFIRSDEYGVNTLMAFSQYPNHFGYFSEIFRAVPTDMFIVYGQAVLDIAVIFRPFNIGYLFLNQGMGLSFFWVSRFVILALISFEAGMLITNKNKTLALSYAFLIVLSPLVQWWFAINGLVEQLIFGQLGVLLINFYMNTQDYIKRSIYAFLMIICVGGFLVVFYPSWQIPFAYVFILMAFWIFLKNRPDFIYNKKDLFIIIAALAIFSLIIIHILNNSLETIKIIMNSAYPGGEVFNGDGFWGYFVNYIPSVLFPIQLLNVPLNVVEHSVFIDFFPIPLIVSLIVLLKQKTKDKLLVGLLVLYLLFVVFYFISLPDSIISITLRNHMKSSRLFCIISFISLLILIRALASLKEIGNKKLLIIFSFILSALMVYLSTLYFVNYYVSWMIIGVFALYSLLFSSIFLAHDDKGKKLFLICVICISLFAGGLANPIDQGTDVVFKNDFAKEVTHIVEQNPDANWLVQSIHIDYLTVFGAKTVNSVNTYPDLGKWHQLDMNNESEEIYNRYSHILVQFVNDSNTHFELCSTDVVQVYLNVNDLSKLNISYIASPNNLEQFNNENVTFISTYDAGSCKIYKVNYSK